MKKPLLRNISSYEYELLTKTCVVCGQTYPLTNEQRARIKSERISRAMSGREDVGRPRKSSYEEIVKLRKSGMKLAKIAKKLGVSLGSISYALKLHSRGRGE